MYDEEYRENKKKKKKKEFIIYNTQQATAPVAANVYKIHSV